MFSRIILGLSIIAGLWAFTPTSEAEARGVRNHRPQRQHVRQHRWRRSRVPELDPSAAGGALVLLIGGVAYIASRRREDEELT